MTLLLRFTTHSETGLVRKNNQDSGYASPHLLVVADGMGGAAAGDLASAVAVEAIRLVDRATPGDQMLTAMAGALADANDRIAALVAADVVLDGMGTTVTGALFDGAELGLAHIGDSRAYLFRDGRLERLTHDHSWVQSLVDDGRIDEAEAAVHPHRSLLLKVLNGQPGLEADLTRVPLRAGDRLLLCSDGLCGLVDDDEIADALRHRALDAVVAELVAGAHAGGGIDNITLVLADVVEAPAGGAPEPAAAVVLGAAADRQASAPEPVRATPAERTEGYFPDGDAPEPTRGTGAGQGAGRGATAVGAAGSPAAEDEARYNPQAPSRRRVRRPLAGVLVALLVVAAVSGAAYAWGRTQYYVGAAGAQVAIYQGLPERVVVPLSRVFEVQPVALDSLPVYYQTQVLSGIEVSGLDSARETVAELSATAKRCAGRGRAAMPSSTASPASSPSPSRRTPGGSPTASPPTSASPSDPTSGTGC